jgi:hypothetical protein
MYVKPYPPEIEERMKSLYKSLNERDRRKYAAIEAAKLGYGGRTYLVALLGLDYKTLRRGLGDLDHPPELPPGRIRKKGGAKVLSC